MTAVILALLGSYGVHLIYTAVAFSWSGVAPGPTLVRVTSTSRRTRDWLNQSGLADIGPGELVGALGTLFVLGAGLGYVLFGGFLPPMAAGLFAASFPVAAAKSRRQRRRHEAREAWPRMIEEIRIKTATLGRSLPQAVIEVGRRAPEDMRPAFAAVEREWLISTDFPRTLDVLRSRLADATADTIAETLLVAHQIGGNEVDRCLSALIEDRMSDLQGRKDARSRQAGARFARRFVLVVPLGMAVVGMSIGNGRAAYATPTGQLLVMAAISLMALCWVWAGSIMKLPEEDRVFVVEATRTAVTLP